jgi:methionine synthase I (cobalamin-dependent)
MSSEKHTTQDAAERRPALAQVMRERILVLDGAMGTLIQAHGLSEAEFRLPRGRRRSD